MSDWIDAAANGVAAMLLPMMVRTGLPLLLALIVRVGGWGLVEANFVYYLIGFYLLGLTVELPLSLPRTGLARRRSAMAKSEEVRPHG